MDTSDGHSVFGITAQSSCELTTRPALVRPFLDPMLIGGQFRSELRFDSPTPMFRDRGKFFTRGGPHGEFDGFRSNEAVAESSRFSTTEIAAAGCRVLTDAIWKSRNEFVWSGSGESFPFAMVLTMHLGSLQSGFARLGFLRGIARCHELAIFRAFGGWPADVVVERVSVPARSSTRQQAEMCRSSAPSSLKRPTRSPLRNHGALVHLSRAAVSREPGRIDPKSYVAGICLPAGRRLRHDLDCERQQP